TGCSLCATAYSQGPVRDSSRQSAAVALPQSCRDVAATATSPLVGSQPRHAASGPHHHCEPALIVCMERSPVDFIQPPSPLEAPSTTAPVLGPVRPPTHPFAKGPVELPRKTVDGFVELFLRKLNMAQGVLLSRATVNDQYLALAKTVRDYLVASWLETGTHNRANPTKMVGYLSAEYLLGRQLDNALLATELTDIATNALAQCGIDMDLMRA